MMGVQSHSENPADVTQIDIRATFRLTGLDFSLGDIEAVTTLTSTDTPSSISAKIQTAVIARAAEYGVTLAAADITPIVFSLPTSLVSALNSSTLTLTDDGVNQTILGSLGLTYANSPWRFDTLTAGGKLGVGRDPVAGIAIRLRVAGDGSNFPAAVDAYTEVVGGNEGVGVYSLIQHTGDPDTGAMMGSRCVVSPLGIGKACGSSVGSEIQFNPIFTDATTTMTDFRGFHARAIVGSTLTLTNYAAFDADAQPTYGTNVWGIRTGNKAEFSSPSAKAETVLLLRQLSTGTGGGAHINFDSKAGDATTPTAGDFWRNADALKFRGASSTFTLIKQASPQTYTVTNLTTDRAYNANSVSIDELADVVGTLIGDLRSIGIVA